MVPVKTLITTLAVIGLLGCEAEKPQPSIDHQSHAIPEPLLAEKAVTEIEKPVDPRPTYDAFLKSVSASNKTPQALFQFLDKDMPDYWDETKWSFGGVSRTPGEGEIACGYFVTTLLKDMGFEIDRIRLAQAPSSVMIKELTTDIKIANSLDTTLEHIKNGPKNSIYIIGLDFHTGFVSHSDAGTFFIHSNYIGSEGVVKEEAATSKSLLRNKYFMVGNLTSNTDFIQNW